MPSVDPAKVLRSGKTSSQKNLQAVRALVFPLEKSATPVAKIQDGSKAGHSKQLPEDPLVQLTSDGKIIEPPFDLLALAMLPERNTELRPVLEAMEINIEGFGHRLVPRVDMDRIKGKGEAAKKLRKAVKKEHVMLTNFFAYTSLRESFTDTRRRHRADLESTGNSYLELIRNAAGDIRQINHLPSYQMRLGIQEAEPVRVDVPILELQEDDSVKVVKVEAWERFRLFVQSRAIQRQNLQFVGTHKLRYFKEFGDPRTYDNETGEEVTGAKIEALPESKRANEVVHFRLYSPRTPYGLPRYIGNLLSIFGDRAAEEINFTTFQNNNVPSIMLLISNGQLTEATIQRIKEHTEKLQTSDNRSTVLLIEAEGVESEEGGEDGGHVKIEAVPMQDSQHNDALFQNYQNNNSEKIRRSFRMPPILVGSSSDYTRATAEASRRLADEQVFAPERDVFDEFINRRLFPDMEVIYHRYKSNSPNTTDNTELVKLLANAEKTGGMTPRIARLMLSDILSIDLPEFSEKVNPDVPFSLTMAEAVKNQADPTEPGQQVTALKTLDLIEKLTGGDLTEQEEIDLVGVSMRLQQHFEKKYAAEIKATHSELES